MDQTQNNIKINLGDYKSPKANMFTGRPQGEEVRAKLILDKYDKTNINITFEVPSGTISINPSFFLGLLFDSYKNIEEEIFRSKYRFNFDSHPPEIQFILQANIEDGIRYARNSKNIKQSLNDIFSKK
jgi:hypothetical protein